MTAILSDPTVSPNFDRTATAIRFAAGLGLVAALVGFIDGIVLMAKRRVTDCPNGHFFPQGTKNFNCYTNPSAAEGLAIAAIALCVGVLVLLVAYVAIATFKNSAKPA